jgi:hypothetical protein
MMKAVLCLAGPRARDPSRRLIAIATALNQQIPHLVPIFLDRGNRLLKAKPP